MKSSIFALAAAMLPSVFAAPSPAPAVPAVVEERQILGVTVSPLTTVIAENGEELLVQLSPDVVDLISGLGLPGIGAVLGDVILSAVTLTDLIEELGPEIDDVVTVTSDNLGVLLISLSPQVVSLLNTIGFSPAVSVPIGSIIINVAGAVAPEKRQLGLLHDLAPQLNGLLTVTGLNAEALLIQLAPSVAVLLAGLGLPGLGVVVGSVILSASSVGQLLQDLAPEVEDTVIVVADGAQFLLISLAPSLAALVAGLGLPGVGLVVGSVVATIGGNL